MTDQKAYAVQETSATYGVNADVIRAHIKAGKLAARYPASRPILGAMELLEWFEAPPSEPGK